MPPFGRVSRRDLIRFLRKLGVAGPFSGGRYQFMSRGEVTVFIPSPHQGDIGRNLLARLFAQAGIPRTDWESLLAARNSLLVSSIAPHIWTNPLFPR